MNTQPRPKTEQELIKLQKEGLGMDNIELLQTTDCRTWANAFNDMLIARNEQPYDPETLYSWFANAIQTGYDKGYTVKTGEITLSKEKER